MFTGRCFTCASKFLNLAHKSLNNKTAESGLVHVLNPLSEKRRLMGSLEFLMPFYIYFYTFQVLLGMPVSCPTMGLPRGLGSALDDFGIDGSSQFFIVYTLWVPSHYAWLDVLV